MNRALDILKGRKFALFLQVSILLLFVLVTLGMVFSRGVCCADDSYNAVAAKNLVAGLGWSSTLQTAGRPHYTIRHFDLDITTGPTLIFPAALAVWLFGNTYWAPGLAMVTVCTLLLLLVGFYLNKISRSNLAVTLGVFIFFSFTFLFLKFHFEHWYALLGEVPAALLLTLAILVFVERDSSWDIFFVGILFSFAALTKFLATLAFGPFLVVFVLYQFTLYKKGYPTKLYGLAKPVLILLSGFVIPLTLFEIWRLANLGVGGYAQNIQELFHKLTIEGIELVSLSTRYGQASQTMIDRFGLFLPALPFIFLLVGLLIKNDAKVVKVFVIISAMIGAYTIYWVFLSTGRARYFVIAIVLLLFALALPYLASNNNRHHLLAYSFSLLVLSSGMWNGLFFPFQYDGAQLYRSSPSTESLLQVGKWLSPRLEQKPFVTQWWATAADVEYIMAGSLNFTTYRDPFLDLDQPFTLVVNSKFLNENDQDFLQIMELCQLRNYGPYIVGECSQ
jgi:hypothetical protein